jgi:hypothetical protein
MTLGVQLLKLWLASILPLFGDEAFYLFEGRHFAAAYDDVPLLLPWSLALADHAFAGSLLGLRLQFCQLGLGRCRCGAFVHKVAPNELQHLQPWAKGWTGRGKGADQAPSKHAAAAVQRQAGRAGGQEDAPTPCHTLCTQAAGQSPHQPARPPASQSGSQASWPARPVHQAATQAPTSSMRMTGRE